MRRPVRIALVAVAASVLAGCTAGPVALGSPGRAPIFDRAQTDQDVLPDDVPDDGYVAGSIRYVGEDSVGGRYWVALREDESECIIADATGAGDWAGFCARSGLSGTLLDGATVEFATAPQNLDPASAERVGDAILVERP
ncbi:hypothetical protein [Microbacterium sp. VKM Ac-2923]|uniref:hypothetical protein n=1 Tax=Microbacterium sp. VKM Ac-2923 TaxID=2929476 RepID=UPI001FB518B0|nr:hypothetical protein [Microbacterium sp. VKM Ac-2923]MCJ1707827.1 hypothetical protein [Microbacterium sp. VKM Ac-2923]